MELKVFTVFDSASEAYMQPIFALAEGVARRSFADAVNDPSTPFGQHPEHYTLFHVGKFDDNTGELLGSVPRSLCNGLEVKET